MSRRYIAGVVAGALAAAGLTLAVRGADADGVCWALVQALLVVIGAEDVRTRRIRNTVTIPAAAAALLLRAAFETSHLAGAVAAGAIAFAAFLALSVVGGGGIGMGDVKLAALIGVLLGGAALAALIIGTLLGGVASAVVLFRTRSRRATLAYGPYLCLGAAITILLADIPPLV